MVTLPVGYYNRFNAADKYKQMLFRAGRGLQSAEMNEVSETLHYELKTIADSLFNDGALLKGGAVTARAGAGNFTISQALFWARGYTHIVPSFDYTITGLETVTIGIAIVESVITEDDDADLRDPAVNTRNFNEPGAHRLKMDAYFKKSPPDDDEFFYGIIDYVDGVQVTPVVIAPDLDGVKDLVARYDNAANGPYVVDGLFTTFVDDDNIEHEHIMSVSAGTAHVQGYEQIFEYAQTVRVPWAEDTRSIQNEPVTFTADGDYPLRWSPIAGVTEVNGTAQVVETVTHGVSGSTDQLAHSSVISIQAVNQGGTWNGTSFTGGTTYVVTTSYVQSGDGVSWAPAGAEPSPGSTYTVVYRYSKTVPVTISVDLTTINVTGFVSGTTFFVDYTHYIPKYARIVLNVNGTFQVVNGVANYLNPRVPNPASGLTLATLYLLYGKDPVINIDYFRAFRMSDNFNMQNEIDDIKYNVAKLSLNDQIRDSDPSTTKKGQFVDPLTNDILRDAGIAQNAFTTVAGLTPEIEFSSQTLRTGGLIYLPFTEASTLEQPYFTKDRKVNPFVSTDPLPGTLTLTPATYRWIYLATSTTNIIDGGLVKLRGEAAVRWWIDAGMDATAAKKKYNTAHQQATQDTVSSTNSTQTVVTSTVPLPSTTVALAASKFNGGESIKVYFDGVEVATTTADGSGNLAYNLTTPVWAQSGARRIRVVGQTTGVSADAIFTGTPFAENTVINILRTRLDISYRDPLAETFFFGNDQFLTSVDLIFTANAASNSPVDILIAEVVLGIPDRTKIVATKRVYSTSITPNPTGETWTTITFDNPVYTAQNQEYALIVSSSDPTVSIRVAELGGYDTVHARWISKNAYQAGVLLQSANLSTWEPLSKEDMTFRLKKAVFSSSNTTTFPDKTVTGITDLAILAGVDALPGTAVSFTVILVDRSNETYVLNAYSPINFATYTGTVRVSMTMTTDNPDISPVVDGDITLQTGVVQFPSTSCSRAVPINTATNQKAWLEIYEEVANQIVVEYRNAADTAWVAMTRDTGNAVSLGDGWLDMPFTASASGLTSTRYRISLTSGDVTKRPAATSFRVYYT